MTERKEEKKEIPITVVSVSGESKTQKAVQSLDPNLIDKPMNIGNKIIEPSNDAMPEGVVTTDLSIQMGWLFKLAPQVPSRWKMKVSVKQENIYLWRDQIIEPQQNNFRWQEYILKKSVGYAIERFHMPYNMKLEQVVDEFAKVKLLLKQEDLAILKTGMWSQFDQSETFFQEFKSKRENIKSQRVETTLNFPFWYKAGVAVLNENRLRSDLPIYPTWSAYVMDYDTFRAYHDLDDPTVFTNAGLSITRPVQIESHAFWMAPPKTSDMSFMLGAMQNSVGLTAELNDLYRGIMRKVIDHKEMSVEAITAGLSSNLVIANNTKMSLQDLIPAITRARASELMTDIISDTLFYGAVEWQLDMSTTPSLNYVLLFGALSYMAFTPAQCLSPTTLDLCKSYVFDTILRVSEMTDGVQVTITLPETINSALGTKSVVTLNRLAGTTGNAVVPVGATYSTFAQSNRLWSEFFGIARDVLQAPLGAPTACAAGQIIYPYMFENQAYPYGNAFKVLNLMEALASAIRMPGAMTVAFRQAISAMTTLMQHLVLTHFSVFARSINTTVQILCRLGLQLDGSNVMRLHKRMNSSMPTSCLMSIGQQGLRLNAYAYKLVTWINGFRWDIDLVGQMWQYIIKGDVLSSRLKVSERKEILLDLLRTMKPWFYTEAIQTFIPILVSHNIAPYLPLNENQFLGAIKTAMGDLIADMHDIGGLSDNIIMGGTVSRAPYAMFQNLTDTLPNAEIQLSDYRGNWKNDAYIGNVVRFVHREQNAGYFPVFKLAPFSEIYDDGEVKDNIDEMLPALKGLPPYNIPFRIRSPDKNIIGGPRVVLRSPFFMMGTETAHYDVVSSVIDSDQEIKWLKFQGDDSTQWFRNDLIVTSQAAGMF